MEVAEEVLLDSSRIAYLKTLRPDLSEEQLQRYLLICDQYREKQGRVAGSDVMGPIEPPVPEKTD